MADDRNPNNEETQDRAEDYGSATDDMVRGVADEEDEEVDETDDLTEEEENENPF